ncbi:MAG TPA: GDSL-type esterase/lipase family protein [Steroidobacteraceae bacterium]|nr:GDSL-type esterase/lipase family protein [Steroidobacteraceae bacterium]
MIVVLGASYVNSWPISQIAGLIVVNAGVDGHETRDMMARFEKDVLARQPHYVLIWGFINDYTRNPADKHPQMAKAIEQRITEMVDKALARGIQPVLATEVTLPAAPTAWGEFTASIFRTMGRTSYQDRINTQVMNTNRWLKQFAAQRKLGVLDLQQALAPEGVYREREYSMPDGSHLNPAAYAALTRLVETQKGLFSK